MKFKLVIDKTKEEEVVVTAHETSSLTEQIEALVLQSQPLDRIAAYTEDEIVLLSAEQIECITVLDGKTWAIDTNRIHFRLKQRLWELEQCLPANFIRINKSTLANETRLARFIASFSGAVDAVFLCGHRDYVSRRCFAQIKRRYHL